MHHNINWAKHSYVALCSTSSHPMLGMLKRYPSSETIHLCLDNDHAGQLATRRLAQMLREKELEVNILVDSDGIHCLMIGVAGVDKRHSFSTPTWNTRAPAG